MPYKDPEKARELTLARRRRYNHSEKGKAAAHRYHTSSKGRASDARYDGTLGRGISQSRYKRKIELQHVQQALEELK